MYLFSTRFKKNALDTKINSKSSGLSYLCLVQGEKAQFSRLNEHFSTIK